MPAPSTNSPDDLSDLVAPMSAPAAPNQSANKSDDDLNDLTVSTTPLGKEMDYEQKGSLHKAAGTAESLISSINEKGLGDLGYNLLSTDSDATDQATQILHPTAAGIGHAIGTVASIPADVAALTGVGKPAKYIAGMFTTAAKTIPQTAVSLLTLGGVTYALDKVGNLIYPGLGDKLRSLTSQLAIIPQASPRRPINRAYMGKGPQINSRPEIQNRRAGNTNSGGLEDVQPSQGLETVPYGPPELETTPYTNGIGSTDDYGTGGNLSDFTQ